MAIARAQSSLTSFGAVASGTKVWASNCTSGSLLVAGVACGFNPVVSSVSDGTNGTWSKAVSNNGNPDAADAELWYKVNNQSALKPTVTCTLNQAPGAGWDLILVEYTGMSAQSVLDKFTSNSASTGTSFSTGNIITTAPDLLVCLWIDDGSAVTVSAGTGWTAVQTHNSNTTVESLLEDQGVGTTGMAAGTYAGTATTSATDTAVSIVIASFTVSAPVTDPFPVGYHNEPPNEGSGQATYLRMHHRERRYDVHRRPSGLYAATRDWKQVARGLLRAA